MPELGDLVIRAGELTVRIGVVADVLAIFGIVWVAAGFAFKDTFENLLPGSSCC